MQLSSLFWKTSHTVLAAVLLAVQPISPPEVIEKYIGSPDAVILDVREPSEYEEGHLPGAMLMPWSSGVLAERWEELPRDRLIIVYCRSGSRSAMAAQFLDENGFEHVADMGGFSSYSQVPGAPIETGPYEEPATPVSDWAFY